MDGDQCRGYLVFLSSECLLLGFITAVGFIVVDNVIVIIGIFVVIVVVIIMTFAIGMGDVRCGGRR